MGRAMSIRLMSLAWDAELADSDKLVLLALADWSDDTGLCWPSIPQIAKKCSKSERTVQASIHSLEDAGHLSRKVIVGKGCRYTVHPRRDCTPAEIAPPQKLRPAAVAGTPAAAAPNTSKKHHITSEAKASSVKRATISGGIGATRLPANWTVPSITGPSAEIWENWDRDRRAQEVEAFRDYWANQVGSKALKLDWAATWRTWIKNAERYHPTQKQAGSPC